MTRIILYEILRVVILSLLYTSMYSVGGSLYPEFNPLVGEPFNLVCRIEATTITSTVIRFPNGFDAGYCDPPSNLIPVDCGGLGNYSSALNETEKTVTISTNSLASDVNGTWTCTDSTDTFSYHLVAPIREIKDESFTFFPPSFTGNITSETASISLSATYGCINLPVYFKWFVVDSASNKIEISGTNNTAENSSVCTSLSGFNGYTETKEVNEDVYSSSYVTNLDGSYRIGVEVHYTDEVTTLHSIKYFDTYLVFSSGGTYTPTDNEVIVFVILCVCLLAAYCMVCAVCFCPRSTANKCGNCFLTFCQSIKRRLFDCCGRDSRLRKWFLGFLYLVVYGVIVGAIVLPPVYYAYSKYQEGLLSGVGFVIVLVLSGLCLLVVWMLKKKFFNNDVTEKFILQREKSQKKSTCNKRGPQSTPKDPDARYPTTGRPLPRRPDSASPLTGPFDSVNSPRPIVLAPIENPNIPPSIDTLDEQKTDKKPNDKKNKKKKKKKKMKDEEQDKPAYVQDN